MHSPYGDTWLVETLGLAVGPSGNALVEGVDVGPRLAAARVKKKMAANVIDYRDVLLAVPAVKTHYRRGDLLRDGPHALRPAKEAVLQHSKKGII